MSRTVLLCLALFVGSVSAWDYWFTKNKQTECGKFKTERWGWFFDDSVTDLDTRHFLAGLKEIDADKDGYITFAESTDQVVYNRVYAPLNITSGFTRCESVKYDTEKLALSKEVSNTMFSLMDANEDLNVNMQDLNADAFNQQDSNGDGRVSICEVFQSFMSFAAITERHVYLRQLKYTNLVNKYRKYWFLW